MKRIVSLAVLMSLGAGPLAAQSFRTLTSSRQRSAENDLYVNVEFAAGRFRLGREGSGALYRSKIGYNEERFRPVLDYNGGDLRLGLRTTSVKSNLNLEKHEYDRQFMELSLSPDVPLRLDLSFVAGQADLDLGGLDLSRALIKTGATESKIVFSSPNRGTCELIEFQVGASEFRAEQLGNARCRNLDFAGGAGDLTLDFTGNWGDVTAMNADIKVGVGSLRLNLPREIGVQIQLSRFLSSFDASGFVKRGNQYYTGNWETAKVRLHIDVAAALGSIDVAWK